MKIRQEEQGFILVVAMVLLSILSLIAVTSNFATNTQIKISKMVEYADQAALAANTGLTQLYWFWSQDDISTPTTGQQEFQNVLSFLDHPSALTAPAIYKPTFAAASMLTAPTAADIAASGSGFKVFTLTASGIVDTYSWAEGNSSHAAYWLPQVALWVTTFNDFQAPDYPYTTNVNLTASPAEICAGECRLVTYALGRYGPARRMVRESQSFIERKLKGVSTLTNAPSSEGFATMCNPTAGEDGVTTNSKPWPANASKYPTTGGTLLDATQAPYMLGASPSGVALASNTEVNQGVQKKTIRKGTSSLAGVTMQEVPMILYSGHDTALGAKVDFADLTEDAAGTNMPADKLPLNLMRQSMMPSADKVEYFTAANTQLFSLDHYRWAAEQFTCQDPTKADGQYGNGAFCSKAEALRGAMKKAGYDARVPVTGRMSAGQYYWNVAHGIPMFGMVRVLLPADRSGTTTNCMIDGVSKSVMLHQFSGSLKGFQATGTYNDGGSGIVNPDTNGDFIADQPYTYPGLIPNKSKVGINARVMIYGTLTIDYFADYNIQGVSGAVGSSAGNWVFDPQDGERFLLPLESPDVYVKMSIPMMVNPAMPRFAAPGPQAFPTGAPATSGSLSLDVAGKMNMTNITAASLAAAALASPYEGVFPWSEGMVRPGIGEGNAGTMRLMDRNDPNTPDTTTNQGLMILAGAIEALNGAGQNFNAMSGAPKTQIEGLLNLTRPTGGTDKEYDVVHYYHQLLLSTADPNMANDWPVSPWPGNAFASNFCIGKQDCGAPTMTTAPAADSMGDKLHLLFPSGYTHGWKVSLAALDIKADEWNTLLSSGAGITGLRDQLVTGCTASGTGTGPGCPNGLPFSMADAGYASTADVQNLEDGEAAYFHGSKVLSGVGKDYIWMDSAWADIPSMIYSGGLIDSHSHANVSGVIYTPGPLEWGVGKENYDYQNSGAGGLSYVSGAIITGMGMAIKYGGIESREVFVFDSQSVDNVAANQSSIVLRRYDWQALP